MSPKSKALVLLSGGLDSEVSAFLARDRVSLTSAITFDYGQLAAKQEIKAARAFSEFLKIPHRVISLEFLKDALSSALTEGSAIPDVGAAELNDPVRTQETAQAVWVPNRNGLFLNIAAAIAEKQGIDWIVCGFNREEAATFPDNSREFVDMAALFFHYSTRNSVRVLSETLALDKREIVQIAKGRGMPLSLFWSCYRDESDRMCGRCESCSRAIRALKAAELWDELAGRFEK